jgi:hypothetical protein
MQNMDFLSIVQVIGVIGAIVCWIAASILVSKIRAAVGMATPWYRTFMWWIDYQEMRQADVKPDGYDTLTIFFYAFLVFGMGPLILRLFI